MSGKASPYQRLRLKVAKWVDRNLPPTKGPLTASSIMYIIRSWARVAQSARFVAFGSTNDMNAAVEQFREAVRLDPSDAGAQASLGMALAELGRLPEAKACFERALQLNPDNAMVRDKLQAVEQMMASHSEDIWTELSFAVPSVMIGRFLSTIEQAPETAADTRAMLGALLK